MKALLGPETGTVSEINNLGDDLRWSSDDGWAWNYVKYSKSQRLADLERQARAAKKGLWAGKSPLAPWVYRAEKARKARERNLQKEG